MDFHWRHERGPRMGVRDRVRRRSPINNKRGAEEYERILRERLMRGEPLDVEAPLEAPRLKAFAEEFMSTYAAANNKPSEREAKRSMLDHHLLPALGHKRLDAIGIRDIEALRAKMRGDGLSPKRINNVIGCLNRVLRYAIEADVIKAMPKVKPLRVPPQKFDFFTFEEYARLIEAVRHDRKALAMVLLAGDGGLRKGEIAAIEWGDIDLKSKTLTVRRNAWFRRKEEHVDSPKSGRDRTIDLTDRLHDALRAHRHLRGERVFCSADNARLTPGVMEGVLNHATKKAGLRCVGWHVLRHTFCSHLAMTGADTKTIQEFAGHSTLTMTLRYMHLAPGHKREAIARLERLSSTLTESGHLMGIERVPSGAAI